jgi:hypothetical protein
MLNVIISTRYQDKQANIVFFINKDSGIAIEIINDKMENILNAIDE